MNLMGYYQLFSVIWFARFVRCDDYLDGNPQKLPTALKTESKVFDPVQSNNLEENEALRRIQDYLLWMQEHIELSEATIIALLNQEKAERIAKFRSIFSADGILILTPKGFYVSLSHILIFHLAILIILALIVVFSSKSSSNKQPPAQKQASLEVDKTVV
ncbi:uncharacterized protein LOC131679192 [Topomyia yanbarensis]|uniref:uncharacterized protein LOC131679192 n=1 Tax=Topomyia yanbarensis TaxID=2498891 RepID=UPI00273BD33B|nr:uncharacterized protein LOC131679192 [Topomyia yanbarensis]